MILKLYWNVLFKKILPLPRYCLYVPIYFPLFWEEQFWLTTYGCAHLMSQRIILKHQCYAVHQLRMVIGHKWPLIMPPVNHIITLFFISLGFVFSEDKKICSVEHVEAIELPRFQDRNHTNVLISWKNNCKEKQIRIKVKHLLFLGCKNSKRDFSSKVYDVDGGLESFIMENLYHFSKYQLELCFLPNCEQTWSQGSFVISLESQNHLVYALLDHK